MCPYAPDSGGTQATDGAGKATDGGRSRLPGALRGR
jgi:hypothetical protein